MSTSYDQRPTLEERVRASQLIVVGRVESVELLSRERIGETEEQQAIAYITVEQVLRGDGETRRLGVRFILPGNRKSRTGAEVLRQGQQLVLFLVPDVGRGARPNTFIAYLRGHFSLTKTDVFVADGQRVGLKALASLVRTVEAAQAAESQAWSRYEHELIERPATPQVTEIAEPQLGAGPITDRPERASTTRRRRTRRRPE